MRAPTTALLRPRSILLLAAAILAVACDGKEDRSLAADSALARDLTLASAELSDFELRDSPPLAPPPSRSRKPGRAPAPRPAAAPSRPLATAPTPVRTRAPAPSAPAPAPTPAPSAASSRMIAAGTTMSLSVGSRVCTSNRVGDKFVATLTEAVIGSNGASIPAGTRAVIEVASVTPAADGGDPRIVFRVRTISTDQGPVTPVGDAVPQDSLEKVRVGGGSDAKKVAAGVIAGAIIGQMIGKDTRGTVIGAATGGAAGTIAARRGAKYDGCLPQGGNVRLVLAEGLIMG